MNASRHQDQLADRLAGLEIAMGLDRVRERKRLVDVELQASIAHEIGHCFHRVSSSAPNGVPLRSPRAHSSTADSLAAESGCQIALRAQRVRAAKIDNICRMSPAKTLGSGADSVPA